MKRSSIKKPTQPKESMGCMTALLVYGLLAFALFSLLAGGAAIWAIRKYQAELPDLSNIRNYRPPLITEVYADDGTLIAEYFEQRRKIVQYDEIPQAVINAFVAAEDAEFFQHQGINPRAILRAMVTNMKEGRVVQGGSTITQQVTKSLLLTPEKSYERKIKEALLAGVIEKRLTKEEILFLYLNQIFFGHRAYGVASACEVYFGKPLAEITLPEAAILAGLPQAPSRLNPISNFERAKKRQRYVLGQMLALGMIDREEYEWALDAPMEIVGYTNPAKEIAPYFAETVRRRLEERYGEDRLYNGGLRVHTTVDLAMDRASDQAIGWGLLEHDRRQGYRGPLRNEGWEEARTWLDAQRKSFAYASEDDPGPLPEVADTLFRPEGLYEAWVEALDEERQILRVRLGRHSIDIGPDETAWTRPKETPRRKFAIQQVFAPGDVLLVRVLSAHWDRPVDDMGPPFPNIYLQVDQEPEAEGALVAMDPSSRKVLALAGGWSFRRSQFNRAIQSRRQPGSAFKPFVYATALAQGYTAASLMVDSPIVYEDVENGKTWKPRNYSNRFAGITTLRTALAKSSNLIAIKLLKAVGVREAIGFTQRFGIDSDLAPDLSLGLGSSGVSLLELTNAYAVFAAEGAYAEPAFIQRVIDRDGHVLEEYAPPDWPTPLPPEWPVQEIEKDPQSDPAPSLPWGEVALDEAPLDDTPPEPEPEEIEEPIEEAPFEDPGVGVSPQLAFLMTHMLQKVVTEGTGWRARALGRPVAGKTGTTNGLKDAWFLGYTPEYAVGVWTGYDDEQRSLGNHETGSRTASPIFVYWMERALLGLPHRDFAIPSGIAFEKIDGRFGALAGPNTEKPYFEAFGDGTQPTETPPEIPEPRRNREHRALGY